MAGGLWCPGVIAWAWGCLVADDAGSQGPHHLQPQSYRFSKDFLQAFGNSDSAAVIHLGCSWFLIPPDCGALGQATMYTCGITSNMKG